MQNIDLDGTWEFRAIDAYGTSPKGMAATRTWMTGTVPGTVHTDLMARGVIPDPFYRMNENDVQWVDTQQWVYRRQFNVPASFLSEEAVHLVCNGLDTYASIRINGKRAEETSNMFVEHRLDVKNLLKAGRNTVEIHFDSPVFRPRALEKKHGPLRVALESHRVYARKAQYSYSWDWGPKLTTSGIWRSIGLQAYSVARLFNPFARVISLNRKTALVELSVDIEQTSTDSLAVRVVVDGGGRGGKIINCTAPVRGKRATCRVRIQGPKMWWPNGCGDQPMYKAAFSLYSDGREFQSIEIPFALRTVRLVQEKDDEGRSFVISLNGTKIYCKGADWIPSDSFIPRIPDSTYERLLGLARDAHMNMVRVWGGGIYEQDVFYDTCDRLGLMVWQDFMFACGEYPEEPWFLRQVKEEAEKIVKRLRNHPSIVVWCGNNECEWLFCSENPSKTPDDMTGAPIFRDILPSVCSVHDGTRIYWRSSPFGQGFPNAESNGTHHQWSVWSAWRDYKEYEKNGGRFVAEFGFQAPANSRTFEEVTVAADRSPQSPVMEHHNKQVGGPERLYRFQSAHYRVGSGFDEFIYKGQLVQGEALKCAVEHWRRRKFRTGGSLFWQLNDCWPVSSWAVIDSALRPKAGYYYAKRFFAPVLVSFKDTGDGREVWLTNDLPAPVRGRIVVSLRSFDGMPVWRKQTRCRAGTNSSRRIMVLPSALYAAHDPSRHYLLVHYSVGGKVVSENRSLLTEPKHCAFPVPNVTATITPTRQDEYAVIMRSTAFVKNVRLELKNAEADFDDNYVDLDAGEPKIILCTSTLSLPEIRRRLTLRWLA